MHLMRRRPAASDPGLLLLRSVCHELRPPVATLTSLVRALEAQPSETRRCELARLAAEHASHAEAVLQQAAAAAYGLTDPADQTVPLHRILPAVVATVPGSRLAVSVSAAAGGCLVPPRHVRQILINLLSNAVRHSPPGGAIRLDGDVRRRRLRLTVADEGRPTPDLAHALGRRTPPAGTKGLGLWMVRQMAAVQGGSVQARRLTPYGLAMVVTLPRRRP
jgi:signal transduction histidine kinase